MHSCMECWKLNNIHVYACTCACIEVLVLITLCTCHTEDRFTIQWDRVHNHDHVANGTFTFQLTLFKNGEIHFVYREVSCHSVYVHVVSNMFRGSTGIRARVSVSYSTVIEELLTAILIDTYSWKFLPGENFCCFCPPAVCFSPQSFPCANDYI